MSATEGRIEARVTAITHEEGSEFRDIALDHPTIRRLTTKFAEGINEALEAKQSGEPWRITYKEQPSTNINPRTNKPYAPRRYWLKGEPTYSGGSANASPSPSASPHDEEVPAFNRRTHPVDAWRITLAAAAKLALQTLPMMPVGQRDFRTQTEIAYAWAEWLWFTTQPQSPSFNGGGQFPSPAPARTGEESRTPGAYDEPLGPSVGATHDAPPPYTDDDAPF
jgi:hypothetical protein